MFFIIFNFFQLLLTFDLSKIYRKVCKDFSLQQLPVGSVGKMVDKAGSLSMGGGVCSVLVVVRTVVLRVTTKIQSK